jgi:PAS domain S-box-containing protein
VNPEQRAALWRALATDGTVSGFFVDLRQKTGEIRHLMLAAALQGEVARGFSVDVTEQRAREHELEAAFELNRRIMEAMPGGVVHVRKDGSIAAANTEACRVMGLTYDALTQRYTADFETETVHEDGSPCENEHYPVTHALLTGESQPPHTIGVRRPDGETSWAVFRAVPVLDPTEGSVTGAVVTFFDITERKRTEQALQQAQRVESLGVLAGGLAHDFNNPLAAVLGNAGLMRTKLAGREDLEEHIAALEAAVARASDLTQQMLAYAGRGRVRSRSVDLNAVVREVVGLLESVVSKKAELRLELSDELPAIEGDSSQLHQVLMNLVINASDALGKNPGSIVVRTFATELERDQLSTTYVDDELDSGRYVVLEVSDSGAGMDAATRARVFDPFFTTKATGRGLGLAATLGIVRAHGGAMDVESALGEGSVLRAYLPSSKYRAPTATREPSVSRPRPGLVLVVDDESAVRKATCGLLEQMGYTTLSAASGRDARATLAARFPEVAAVVLDLNMPDSSGGEVLADLMGTDPDVRVVLVSGYGADDVEAQLSESSHVEFLQKPYTASALVEAIERVRSS